MSWETSTRRSRLPADWPKRRQRTKTRAKGMCEAQVHEPECDGIGSECDHIIAGDDHSLSNLQYLSGPCHAAKTQVEAQAAARTKRQARMLPQEQHPGTAGWKVSKRPRER